MQSISSGTVRGIAGKSKAAPETACLTVRNEDDLDVSDLLELALSQLGCSRERIIRYSFLVEEALHVWRQELPADALLTFTRRDTRKTVVFEFSLPGEKADPFAGPVLSQTGDASDFTEAQMIDRLLSGVGSEFTYSYKSGVNRIRLSLPKDNIERRIFRYNTLLLMAPIALQCLFSNVASNIDTLMLGGLSTAAMSGVSLASAFVMIPLVLIEAAGCGETTLLAQYWGKRDRESARQIVSLSLLTALGIALLFSLASFFAPQAIMGLYSNDAGIVSAAADYLRWISPSFLISAVYLTLFSFLQCTGGVRKVLWFSLVGCACNVTLNLVLIFGVWGIPALGVRGAALATVISASVQAVLAVGEVRRQGAIRLRLATKYSINCKDFARCVAAIAAQRFSWNLANNVIIAAIGHMSADIVAANSVLLVLSGFVLSLKSGFGTGVGIQIGALLGKNRFDEAKERAADMQKCGSLVALALVPVFALIGFSLRFISADFTAGTIHYMDFLLAIYSFNIFFNFMNSLENLGFLYAGGDVQALLIIDTAVMWGVMVPVALLSISTTLIPHEAALVILLSNEALSFPLKFWRVHHYKWLRNLSDRGTVLLSKFEGVSDGGTDAAGNAPRK